MSVWVIIPVKPLNRAKSRLATVMTPEQRQQLAEALLRHTLQVVTAVPHIVGTLVISRDTKVLAIARDSGVNTVQESGSPELNAALTRATHVVSSWGCSATLVLPADLPLLTEEDVQRLVELGEADNTVVIATDANRDGTNALFTRPPGLIPYAYGLGSYERHIELAKQAGAAVQMYSSERLMLDIDLPQDLEKYNRLVRSNGHQPLYEFTPDKNLT